MKRVRFLTPVKPDKLTTMNELDCHSPRPFIERHLAGEAPVLSGEYPREILYSPDPVRRQEASDSSPYPIANKTALAGAYDKENQWSPSNDLELSMLDASNQQPRKPVYYTSVGDVHLSKDKFSNPHSTCNRSPDIPSNVLNPIQNTKMVTPPNILTRGGDFFITRGNFSKFRLQEPVNVQMNNLSLNKENYSNFQADLSSRDYENDCLPVSNNPTATVSNMDMDSCKCHHCVKVVRNDSNFNTTAQQVAPHCDDNVYVMQNKYSEQYCVAHPALKTNCNHCKCNMPTFRQFQSPCCNDRDSATSPSKFKNAIDKKTWAIQRYEQRNSDCTDVEKQTNISKEKREPTVADLLKIIKLQNEQLQLLQEKVDKLITTNSRPQHVLPLQNIITETVSMETVNTDQHKISIGVMTSLEMVRTSTVINKDQVLKKTHDNAQIQCNRSEISIKEVVAKQPVNLNFLDGISPVGKVTSGHQTSIPKVGCENSNGTAVQQISHYNEEKTLNEMSLYNVQVDNATTPLMSPEQSLYLDVRDFSDSDSGSDHSNVGWTYYNKVMTHVNGMLQDSDMPSSASALYRNTRQQCVQMQIDKTNISVTKRVTFGDDPLVRQAYQSTDSSMRMNQLAAKYLKTAPAANLTAKQTEMSFATRNYMERHKLLQGQSSARPSQGEIPRFLDITTLKQQPKLL